jgi:hypothetical protein
LKYEIKKFKPQPPSDFDGMENIKYHLMLANRAAGLYGMHTA